MVIAKKIISVRTSRREELVDITQQVMRVVREAGVKDGICIIYCPHTTAGLTINESADPSVKSDLLRGLEAMLPDIKFSHAEGNSDAHIKASMMGFSLQVLINKGRLVLGTWQGVYFCEFDGPRSRKLHVQVME